AGVPAEVDERDAATVGRREIDESGVGGDERIGDRAPGAAGGEEELVDGPHPRDGVGEADLLRIGAGPQLLERREQRRIGGGRIAGGALRSGWGLAVSGGRRAAAARGRFERPPLERSEAVGKGGERRQSLRLHQEPLTAAAALPRLWTGPGPRRSPAAKNVCR